MYIYIRLYVQSGYCMGYMSAPLLKCNGSASSLTPWMIACDKIYAHQIVVGVENGGLVFLSDEIWTNKCPIQMHARAYIWYNIVVFKTRLGSENLGMLLFH